MKLTTEIHLQKYYVRKTLSYIIAAVFILHQFFYNNLLASEDPTLKTKASNYLSQTKALGFQENKGQIADTDGNLAPYVLYKAEAPGIIIWVTNTGLTYQFLKFEESSYTKASEGKEEIKTSWHRVDMILKDASIKKENVVSEGNITQGNISYYLGHCQKGVFNVNTFTKITIKNIYPGIDWVLYTNQQQNSLKQDFIVHPNADPNQLKIIYEGSGRFEAINNQIHFENEIGELQEGKLFCYQENENSEVASNYIVKKNENITNLGAGNFLKNQVASTKYQDPTTNNQQPTTNLFSYEVSIQLNNYDQSKTLTIDPQLTWGTFFGGSLHEGGQGITSDPSGNVIITGYLGSLNFPVLNAGGTSFFQGINNGVVNDAYIIKFSNTGVQLWATYFGGNQDEEGICVTSDQIGNIFVTGYSSAANFPTLNPGAGAYYQGALGGTQDAYIAKFNSLGALIWSTYLGGNAGDTGRGICTDASGNVYVTGTASSANFPISNLAGAYNQAIFGGGASNAFVTKFNNAGVLLWSTFLGGSVSDFGVSITSDNTGNVFLVGYTVSPNFPLANPGGGVYYQAAPGGARGAFITKFNNAGAMTWSTYFGGNASDMLMCVKADALGNIFISGESTSANTPTLNPGGGAYFQAAPGAGGTKDAIFYKFSNTGVMQWGTYFGGNGDETQIYADGIAIDSCNNVYISLESTSTNTPTKTSCDNGFNDATLAGTQDQFINKFSNTGVHLWGTYVGGEGTDFGAPITIDNNGNLFMTGEWTAGFVGNLNAATYPMANPGGNAYNTIYNGGADDSYIVKFAPPLPVTASASSTPSGCTGNTGTATGAATNGCAPYQYTWYNSSWVQIGNTQTISNLAAGTYHVIIQDSMSCSKADTATAIVTGGGQPVTFTQNPVICVGSNFTLPGGTIVSTAGTYYDTIQLGNGCDSIITTILTLNNFVTTSQNPIICAGNSFTLPDGSSTGVAGTYTDTVTAQGGCDSIITTTLTVNPASTFSQAISICSGASYTRPGGVVVTTAGTYADTLSTTAGCDSIITTTLTVNPASTFSQAINICNGASYTRPGGAVVTTAGTYIDTVSTTAGCDSIITTTLALVNAVTTSQSAALCNGNSYTLPGGTIVNTAGVYNDTLTALVGGCDSIITTTITIKPNATSGQTPNICSGNSFRLPGGTIVTTSGIYYDTLTSFNGCDSIITTTLTVNPAPTAGVSPDVIIISGSNTTLTASGGGTYSWTPSTGLNTTTGSTVIASPTQTTTYCVEVTTTNGCKDTACVTVTTEVPCPENENLAVPNAFSPNGDNVNDEFCLQGWTPCNEEFQIFIYSRWGEKVFESKDPNFCWDGKYKGAIMDAQVFVYYLRANYINEGNTVTKEGNISLIR